METEMTKPSIAKHLSDDDSERVYAERLGISYREYQAYRAQKNNAKRRGIDFLFTPLGWAIWWQTNLPPGASRGRKRDQYVMARIGDRGAYEPDNVKLLTPKGNADDITPETRERMRISSLGHHAEHLRTRDTHPRVRPVLTPDGEWKSAALAAEHYGITRQAAAYRARNRLLGWSYTR